MDQGPRDRRCAQFTQGRSLAAGLQLLAPFGRFIEIGKADIYGNGVLSLAPFQRSVAFFAVDLDRVCRERPQLIAQLLAGLLSRLDGGHLKPLPCQTFQMSKAVHAFSQMAKAKHVGKCILSLDTQNAPVDENDLPSHTTPLVSVMGRPAAEAPFSVRPDAAYLITGGLGSLGLEVADWLVQKGAGHLALLGRRAESEAGAEAAAQLDRLRASGACIQTFAVDTSDRSALFAVIKHLDAAFPPVRGIVHAAGVLEDGLVVTQAWARFKTVFASKIDSAWNLHTLTLGRPLDFFVLFSSASRSSGRRVRATTEPPMRSSTRWPTSERPLGSLPCRSTGDPGPRPALRQVPRAVGGSLSAAFATFRGGREWLPWSGFSGGRHHRSV